MLHDSQNGALQINYFEDSKVSKEYLRERNLVPFSTPVASSDNVKWTF